MTTEMAVIVGGLAVAALIMKWYGEYKQREIQSEFFRKTVDTQIAKRTDEIEKVEQEVKESVNDYYKRMAKYHNNLLRGYDDPSDGNGPKQLPRTIEELSDDPQNSTQSDSETGRTDKSSK